MPGNHKDYLVQLIAQIQRVLIDPKQYDNVSFRIAIQPGNGNQYIMDYHPFAYTPLKEYYVTGFDIFDDNTCAPFKKDISEYDFFDQLKSYLNYEYIAAVSATPTLFATTEYTELEEFPSISIRAHLKKDDISQGMWMELIPFKTSADAMLARASLTFPELIRAGRISVENDMLFEWRRV
ncbi:hypothetical protein Brsp06_03489 [Brucella sp. NBRC 13694]|uniref:hypothetical protein n=1 Tax=Brucella sp. NBRC 13694 TaxID=3075482 RepID=UPI0030AC497D